jgi:peptide/nickel transport system substrate-binding protein
MKKIFLLALIAVFCVATLATAASRKDVFVIGMDISDALTLDPAKAFNGRDNGVIVQLYDRLIDLPADQYTTTYLSLAKSWSISDDKKVWTFKLREGVKFHSGNELTAKDVVFSFDKVVTLKETPSFLLTQFGIKPGSTKEIDKYTVQITLDKKYAKGIFFSCLAATVSSIVDSKVAMEHAQSTEKYPDGDMGLTWLATHSAGSGSFKLSLYDKGSKMVLDANPNHFMYPPKIKRVIIKEVVEASSRRLQVEKGDIDFAWEIPEDQITEAKKNKDLKILTITSNQIKYLGMNVGKGGPLANPKVRKAMRYAVNYDGIINNILGGAGQQTNCFIPKAFAGYTDKIYYKTDLEKARQLLKEAGYPDGFSVTLNHMPHTEDMNVVPVIQHSFAKVGIKITLNKLLPAQFWPMYRGQKHDMVFTAWGPDYWDPHANAQPFGDYTKKQLSWRNMYYNDEVAGLINKASIEMDEPKRLSYYQKANEIIQEDGPYVFLYQRNVYHIIRKGITGFYSSPDFKQWKLYDMAK